MRRAVLIASPLLSGCFATRSDLRIVQGDLLAIRAELLRADTVRSRQLGELAQQLRGAQDSLVRLSSRSSKFEGDSREGLYATKEQLLQIQVLLGQSTDRIRQLQAQLEATAESNAAAVTAPVTTSPAPPPTGSASRPPRTTPATRPPAASPSATPPAALPRDSAVQVPPTTPGPNQLYQLALDQLRRGSASTARAGFQDFLRQYPTNDLAADAQFYIAESYASEKNVMAADAAYDEMARRYPTSPKAPTAVYKRAKALVEGGNASTARPILEGLIARWPRADEAELAQELLRTLR
jgi:tol-pal system protein YbgF